MELVIISVIVLTVCFTFLTAAAANRETEAPSEQVAADQAPQTTNQGPPIGELATFLPPIMYAFLYFVAPIGPIFELAMFAQMLLFIWALGQFISGSLLVIAKDNSGWAYISSALLVALMRYGPFLFLLLFT